MTPVPTKLEDRLTELKAVLWKPSANGHPSNSKPKIQKVQPHLRQHKEFARYYSPKLLSIGPICRDKNDEQNLERGEEYKSMWAAMYLEGMRTTQIQEPGQYLLEKVLDHLKTLKALYAEDALQCHDDEELAWIFFRDGCAVLHFMHKVSFENPQDLKMKVDQLVIVLQDLLLLENQLPHQLLRLLSNDDDERLDDYISNFLKRHHMFPDNVKVGVGKSTSGNMKQKGNDQAIITVDEATHLLDILRTAILMQGRDEDRGRGEVLARVGIVKWPTYRNIMDLKASGIRVIKTKDRNASLTKITFKRPCPLAGRLHLSKLIVDDFTAPTFLNMIAYEMCPDFQNHHYEISSYVAFLDSLIDHPDDVKELRKAGVLHNLLGSDEEVATLFNAISTDLVPNTETYVKVRQKIEKHYSTTCITWMAQAYYNHFSSPWTVLGFAGALIALVLSFIQTWYAVHPASPNASNNS